MKKLKCITANICMLCIAISSVAQGSLYVSSGSSILIKSTTVFSVDSLSLTPSSDVTITGVNQFTYTSNPYHQLDRLHINRVFHVLQTLQPFTGAITIYYRDADVNSVPESTLSLAINEDSPNWNIYTDNVTRDNTKNFVTTRGLTDIHLNEATLVDPSGALPLTFALFNVSCTGEGATVRWKAYQQAGIKKFDVEKSLTGRDWGVIQSVDALGQLNTEQSYSVHDNNLIIGNLYRIVQYDMNGRKVISSIIRAACSGNESFNIYPNPVQYAAIINIQVNEASTVLLKLTDGRGSVIKERYIQVLTGTNQVQFDMKGIPNGYYNLSAEWGGHVTTKSIVKE